MSILNWVWWVNEKISLVTNSFVRDYHLTKLVWIMADFPIFFTPVFLVSAWIYWTLKNNDNKKHDLILIFFSVVFSIITNLIIQQIVFEKRPETFVEPLIEHIPNASFPSDHAAVSFAFLTGLYLFGYKKIFWIYLPFVILMNFSRIAGWVHWFWDVVVGAFIGIFWAFIFKKFSHHPILKKVTGFFIKIAKIFKL